MRTHKRLVDITESVPQPLKSCQLISSSGVDIEIKMIMEDGEHAEQSEAKSDSKRHLPRKTAKSLMQTELVIPIIGESDEAL